MARLKPLLKARKVAKVTSASASCYCCSCCYIKIKAVIVALRLPIAFLLGFLVVVVFAGRRSSGIVVKATNNATTNIEYFDKDIETLCSLDFACSRFVDWIIKPAQTSANVAGEDKSSFCHVAGQSRFKVYQPDLCDSDHYYEVVVIVFSPFQNIEARKAIRETWAAFNQIGRQRRDVGDNGTRVENENRRNLLSQKVKVLFIVVQPLSMSTFEKHAIELEFETYQDVVYVDPAESARTKYSIMDMYEFVESCSTLKKSSMLLRIEDHSFVSIDDLLQLTSNLVPKYAAPRHFIGGSIIRIRSPGQNPNTMASTNLSNTSSPPLPAIRNEQIRTETQIQMPGQFLEADANVDFARRLFARTPSIHVKPATIFTFLNGSAYLIPIVTVRYLYKQASCVRLIENDDVLLNGAFARKLEIHIKDLKSWIADGGSSKDQGNIAAFTGLTPAQIREFWNIFKNDSFD